MQPAPPTTPPAQQDTSARQAIIDAWAAQHGGQLGGLSTVPAKDAQGHPVLDKDGNPTPGPYDLVTFRDGSSVEITPDGQINPGSINLKAPPTTQQAQQNAGVLDLGANGVWTLDPTTNKWGPSLDTQNKQQLQSAQTVGQTGVYQAQGNLYNNQAGVVQPNAAAQQYLQGSQGNLYNTQAWGQGLTAPAQAGLYGAQANLQNAQAGVVGGNAAAQQYLQGSQANLYNTQAYGQGLTAPAQAGLYGAQANLQNTQAQLAPMTAQAQAALYGAQANYQNTQAALAPSTAQSAQNLQAAQAGLYGAQAAAQMNPAQLTVNLNNQAGQMAQTLQQQVQQGKLTSDAAAGQFDRWYSENIEPMKQQVAYQQAVQQSTLAQQAAQQNLYNAQAANYPAALAQTASDAAQKNAIALLPYTTGAGYGDAVSGLLSKMGTGKYPTIDPQALQNAATFSLPNLQEIGRQGAAAALANLSPTAAMHAQMPGPPAQPPAGGMPDLTSFLNMNNYGFPQGGNMPMPAFPDAPATPATAVAPAAPATPATPTAPAPTNIMGQDPTNYWTNLFANLNQDKAAQAQQAQIPWGQYQPAA